MKITVIGPTYPYKGGISHFTTLLVNTLRKDNDVNFISWKRQYPSFLYPVELKDTISKNPIKAEAKFILDFFSPLSWLKSFIDIKRYKSNLLILTWVSPIQAPIYFIISTLTRMFSKTKILYICHNVLPHERKFYDIPLAKLAFNQSDTLVVHSHEDKLKLEKIINDKKIILGFHPIYEVFKTGKKYNIQELKKEFKLKNKVLLFFGYIRPYKGLKYLLKAMPEIISNFPDLTLLVVGDFWSKDKKSYFDLINSLNIKDHLIMINKYIPNEEVEKYFLVSDVIVLPYTSATQSGITKIALTFNKPVISTDVGGLKDEVKNGLIDFVILPKSINDIVKKVTLFYRHPIHNKKNNYYNQFSWSKYIDTFLNY